MKSENSVEDVDAARDAADRFRSIYADIKSQVCEMMVGQDEVIDGVMTALFAGGHVLLEGVPGLGKTMLVNSLSKAVGTEFSRIQFTPDLMPADIQGSSVLVETPEGGQELEFQEGPLVSNLVLADEINRATPKTQSALLEAMQERQVTVGKRTIKLEEPFCVLATQNPVEQEGTYPLPEAQLDRFLFKLVVGYPKEQDYHTILDRTTGGEVPVITAATDGAEVIDMRNIVRQVPVPQHAKTYAIHLVMGTQPGSDYAPELVNEYAALGSSPRGAQSLLLAAKVRALLDNRFAVNCQDIADVAVPVLRHRIVINFHGQSDNISDEQLIREIVKTVKEPNQVS
ncbi:MoxR family ATPase [Porticoccus sp. W117]|uniref:AAA family ATPase n=1 Tax=Porticoccus sp. W117 TaxID=3054777 RepID=UPI0025965A1E|nr:MoxR family ATPase [Porticoccus sp. W117]MDM3870349.1 MoxR family ATPase [Porticoccus sp. W117]